MRGAGGNQFYPGDMGRSDFLDAVARGIDHLAKYAAETSRAVDFGALTVDTRRVGGRISVSVTADLAPEANQ